VIVSILLLCFVFPNLSLL